MEPLRFPDGRVIHRTFAWIVPAKDKGRKRASGDSTTNFEVVIDPPNKETPHRAIPDLKEWMLSKEPKPRVFDYYDKRGNKHYIRATAEQVFEGYVKAVLTRSDIDPERLGRVHLLMPALEDEVLHTRYRDTLQSAVAATFPKAETPSLLIEPEMILEFYRYIKNAIRLRQGHNSFVLVVDAGASTTNFTVIITTRSGRVTEAKEKQRPSTLRAISADAKIAGGRAIDRELLRRLAPEIEKASTDEFEGALEIIEQAKIQAARTGQPVTFRLESVGSLSVDERVLRDVAGWFWEDLLTTYQPVAERLLGQLQSSSYALKTYGPVLKERGVDDWTRVASLFDLVLLAGGTSQLPGFESALRAGLMLPETTPVLSVGGAYPVAAAIGGMAHVLGGPIDGADLAASVPYDFILDCEDKKGAPSKPRRIPVLTRANVRVLEQENQTMDLPGSWTPGMLARARLVPSTTEDFREGRSQRKGMGFEELDVESAPAKVSVFYDPDDQFITLTSKDVPDIGKLSKSMKSVKTKELSYRLDSGAIRFSASRDVVIDIGMSKTVIVHASHARTVSQHEFDASDQEVPREPGFRLQSSTADVPVAPPNVLPDVNGAQVLPLSGGIRVVDGEVTTDPSKTKPSESSDSVPVTEPATEPTPTETSPDLPALEPSPPEPASATPESTASSLRQPEAAALRSPLELDNPVERIKAVLGAIQSAGFAIEPQDLALAYLALCTRRFVMLAGPPGSGKSTIARLLAEVLGCASERRFVDISVQAHWVNDRRLLKQSGLLDAKDDGLRLLLLDEMNLTRPEYYLSRLFGALDHHGTVENKQLPPFAIIGTLNVDDCSRPPSPKVLDRSMLHLVLHSQVTVARQVRSVWDPRGAELSRWPSFEPPRRRPAIGMREPSQRSRERLIGFAETAKNTCKQYSVMRADLVPSHRALEDLLRFAALHTTFDFAELIDEVSAMDRAILGRFIPGISGPESEVIPLIDAWLPLASDLPETKRRLERMKEQAKSSGYVSFWQ